ncbi:hypothetical protein [Actinacidiphila rubida]|uniref:Uncharacterized protein n=1 Tax=Actinacidiphila rubida TaxID=310780 RepID=A0A1H8U8X4_9ACTN|nr:hypothetical protein [Actinacidiphila rubida]SEO99536.1 hypothetical protein SAMN05216267_106617 [Actinacidiphila rubida]
MIDGRTKRVSLDERNRRMIQQLGAARPDERVTLEQAEPVDARRLIRTDEADLGLLCNWENGELPE